MKCSFGNYGIGSKVLDLNQNRGFGCTPGHRNVYINGGTDHPYCLEKYKWNFGKRLACLHSIGIELLTYLNNESIECFADTKCKKTTTGDEMADFVLPEDQNNAECHGSYISIIMLEKCNRSDLNEFEVKKMMKSHAIENYFKFCGPFWIYQVINTANSTQFHTKRARLAGRS